MESDIQDFERTVAPKERVFVLFYASWCHFSQHFLPIFKRYAKGNPDEYIAVMVDFKPDLCDRYSIDYYPTVLLFKKGKVVRRLDATPGLGLTEQQLSQLTDQ